MPHSNVVSPRAFTFATPNDRLTFHSKYLHALSKPLNLPYLALSSVDSPLCKTVVEGKNTWYERYNRYRHRLLCHSETFAVYQQLDENKRLKTKITGADRCRTSESTNHCECFVLPLHKRLKGWVPKDLRFCPDCRRFTKRVKKYNMRCECLVQ
jgi:hypothetical protein